MDKRVFLLGVSLLAAGGLSWFYFNTTQPVATSGMTTDQTNAFYEDMATNAGMQNLSGMVAGIGFFIALISVGLRRRKKDGAGKSITSKPAQT
ncbi:MAG: hypothetical protein KGI33_02050 [Thaumarchaeota archaeon]|nr:hypothetical protein [Nitrososphaerota archaeon]